MNVRRPQGRGLVLLVVASGLGLYAVLSSAGQAAADHIPNACYDGFAANGDAVRACVSSDGDTASFSIELTVCLEQIIGTPGVPLQNHAFMYTGGVAVVYYVDGRFEPLGGAHGWFELDASYLFGCTVGPMEWTATTPIPGDMDCSQSLEITDALLIAQSVVSLLVGDPPPCTDQGDTNSDQELDITDALRVAQYVVGLIDSDELVGFRQD